MVFTYKKNEQGLYVCTVCNETREKQNTMYYHILKHEGTKSYACSHCDKKFYQKYALDNHIQLTHSTAPIVGIQCPFDSCKGTFQKKEHCRAHIARNHLRKLLDPLIQKKKDSKVHNCTTCNREFNSYPAILYHVMDHLKGTADPELKKKLAVI